jgi:hypothetical protein
MKIDWTNLEAVIKYAQKLGAGMTVLQRAGIKGLSITHTSRRDRWDTPDVTVLYQTI